MVQFTHESHLYLHTHSQKLEISSVQRVKRSVNMRQHLAVYTCVVSKNAGVQRVKTPAKTPLIYGIQKIKQFHPLHDLG